VSATERDWPLLSPLPRAHTHRLALIDASHQITPAKARFYLGKTLTYAEQPVRLLSGKWRMGDGAAATAKAAARYLG
jgi:hypothetical protein